ncbi:ABC transporter [Pararhodobacter marinus]|uniref:ABC transporter n=1 Tax=Pararhodobacter marinus TaxID=2184063 RepID=A0A2U2CIG4_9RHOB|nr:ABC-F family ATP-binding cassette domain-containing protein [Pararhodobacter marinus]PWE31631.1 ABC transporter [Pararhodobacter marinus]
MPATITLTSLFWTLPDGTPLLTDLSLSFGPRRTGIVGRNGTGKSTLLHLIAGALTPQRGEIAVTGRVAMLRQVFDPGETVADLFGARDSLAVLARAEAGEATLDELTHADWTLGARIDAALERAGVACTAQTTLDHLSGGQATRVALAAAMFGAPDFLLLDEPTNNLDRDGRAAVAQMLRDWPGGALVVSHDRELLDRMDEIVELSSLGVQRYGGGYSDYAARKEIERDAAHHARSIAQKQQADIARQAQQAAERKARSDRAGRRLRASGSQSKMLMDKAKERSEASGGANARLREARATEAEAALRDADSRIEIVEPVRMDLPPSGLAHDRRVLTLERVTGGYDAENPVIRDFSLALVGPERVALTGPNGSGKSTLLALITGALPPLDGRVERHLPPVLLDQSVSLLDPAETLVDAFLRLNPGADQQGCRAVLARFRFRAEDALKVVGTLSGGQRLRAGLACTLGGPQPPGLLILDEPTNHLDLEATQALESALAGYDGAMLVVSHDARFLDALGLTRRIALG